MIDFHLVKQLNAYELNVAHQSDAPFLILMGPSGAGKTTLLDMIAGLAVPDRGFLRLGGKLLYDSEAGFCLPPRDRKMGYIFQSLALFPHMNVMQNILFGAKGKSPDHRQRIREQLEFLSIDHLTEKFPSALSGGERQRVAIARALASEAEILLMDEPFASLDRANRDRAIQLVLSVQAHYGKAMILVTHSLEEAAAFPGDHLEILEGKKILRI